MNSLRPSRNKKKKKTMLWEIVSTSSFIKYSGQEQDTAGGKKKKRVVLQMCHKRGGALLSLSHIQSNGISIPLRSMISSYSGLVSHYEACLSVCVSRTEATVLVSLTTKKLPQ